MRDTISSVIGSIALAGLACGCGAGERSAVSSSRYSAPADRRVVAARIVDAPIDMAWSLLLERAEASPLRLLTRDPSSRFIVLEVDGGGGVEARHEASAPERGKPPEPRGFVDCGRLSGSLTEDDRIETWDFAITDPSRHREASAVEGGFDVRTVTRTPKLEARATLHLQPEGERTRLSVNARYALSIASEVAHLRVPRSTRDPIPTEATTEAATQTIRFTTFEPASLAGVDGGVCRATGEFERRVLALAEPAP